jgi:hypothetical protein
MTFAAATTGWIPAFAGTEDEKPAVPADCRPADATRACKRAWVLFPIASLLDIAVVWR